MTQILDQNVTGIGIPEYDVMNARSGERLERIFRMVHVMLGGSSIDVYLEDDDYFTAFSNALSVYRTYSSRSVNAGYVFIKCEKGRQEYPLDKSVDVVRGVKRTRFNFFSNLSAADPIAMMFLQKIVTPIGFPNSNNGGYTGTGGYQTMMNGGFVGFLADFIIVMDNLETMEKIFGGLIDYEYRNDTNILMIYNIPRDGEVIGVEVSCLKPLSTILDDHWALEWLRKFTLEECREILGQKIGRMAVIPGPTGSISMNGSDLISQARDEKAKLIDELEVFGDSSDIPLPLRG